MAMATATFGGLSEAEHNAQLRKAVIASTVGTAIEWYDFFLYGTAAGLVSYTSLTRTRSRERFSPSEPTSSALSVGRSGPRFSAIMAIALAVRRR